jgi:type IV pilus assembly protein PilF
MSLVHCQELIRVPKWPVWLWFCGYLLLTGCGGGKNSKLAAADASADSPANLYIGLATAYYERGQMPAALENAERAVQADNKSANAHYMLAVIHQRLGQTKEAEQEFAAALRIAPDNPDILNAHGSVLCLAGKYREASAQFEKALKNPLYQTPEVALMNAAKCAERAKQGTEAERHLRNALTANPNFAPALYSMAELSFRRGAYQDSYDYMVRYFRVGQVTPESLLLGSRVLAGLGRSKDAKAMADTLRKRFPDAPQVMQL